jgi:hypothetical protein
MVALLNSSVSTYALIGDSELNKSPYLRGNPIGKDSLVSPAANLRSNSCAGLIMRRGIRHSHEITELLESLNERNTAAAEAILLLMWRV